MERKFKVGDKVRVKDGLKDEASVNGCLFVKSMEKFCGKEVTIMDVSTNRYYIKEGEFAFVEEWLEPAVKKSVVCSYKFKGKLSLAHLIKNCLEDNQKIFIVVGEKNILVGVLRGYDTFVSPVNFDNNRYFDSVTYHDGAFIPNLFVTNTTPFNFLTTGRESIPELMQNLPVIVDAFSNVYARIDSDIKSKRGTHKTNEYTSVIAW